jgi:DNA-binding IclR family transcriptional regulator
MIVMARPRTHKQPETPKVLDKALRVLEAFGGQSSEWSEVALRQHLAMPSTTLNRILRSLERSGYLFRNDDGRYRLGIAAVRLGNRASASLNLPAVLESQMRELARLREELVILAVPEFASGLARYIATADSPKRLRVTAEVGTGVPLTAGATAKTILAFQPQAAIDAVLQRPRESLAAGTVTDLKAIRAQLATITERGWGSSWEETYDGAWAVAAPLLDDERHAFAALGVAAPISRHSSEIEAETRQAVIDTATRAARRLGTMSQPPKKV